MGKPLGDQPYLHDITQSLLQSLSVVLLLIWNMQWFNSELNLDTHITK